VAWIRGCLVCLYGEIGNLVGISGVRGIVFVFLGIWGFGVLCGGRVMGV